MVGPVGRPEVKVDLEASDPARDWRWELVRAVGSRPEDPEPSGGRSCCGCRGRHRLSSPRTNEKVPVDPTQFAHITIAWMIPAISRCPSEEGTRPCFGFRVPANERVPTIVARSTCPNRTGRSPVRCLGSVRGAGSGMCWSWSGSTTRRSGGSVRGCERRSGYCGRARERHNRYDRPDSFEMAVWGFVESWLPAITVGW